MAGGREISGVAVAAATVGALVLYAGLRGVSPAQALRDVLGGHPSPVPAGVPAVSTGSAGASALGKAASATASGGASDLATRAAQIALAQVGKPYRWGAKGPNSFDCSGLCTYAYEQAGVKKGTFPRTTYAQISSRKFVRITRAQVAAGDLIEWNGHVVMALNNTNAVGAQRTGTNVMTMRIEKGHLGSPIAYLRYKG